MFNTEATLKISQEEKSKLLDARKNAHYCTTRFGFLNDHFGLRKKCFHLLMGTAGTGKSTLARSVLFDLAKKHKVFFYCSEETLEQTKTMYALRDADNAALENIVFYHEREAEKDTNYNAVEWLRLLELKIINNKCDVLFFDNLTTSSFYDPKKPQEQSSIVTKLFNILNSCNIAGFFVAHTQNGVKDDQQGLISTSDIRGSKQLTNKAEFVYIYQKFICPPSGQNKSPTTYGTVRNLKARGYDVGDCYLLDYDFNRNEYYGDVKIPNTKFKEIYDERFKLGK
jgi:hypothetical protein